MRNLTWDLIDDGNSLRRVDNKPELFTLNTLRSESCRMHFWDDPTLH